MICKDCHFIYHRLKQQEETIAQLVNIIRAMNRRLNELDQRQLGVEHHIIRENPPSFPPAT